MGMVWSVIRGTIWMQSRCDDAVYCPLLEWMEYLIVHILSEQYVKN